MKTGQFVQMQLDRYLDNEIDAGQLAAHCGRYGIDVTFDGTRWHAIDTDTGESWKLKAAR